MDRRYAEICGFTEAEIRQVLDAQVGELAEANCLSKEDCYAKLKTNYDGYHFEHDNRHIYKIRYQLLHQDAQDGGLEDSRMKDQNYRPHRQSLLLPVYMAQFL